MYMRSMLQSFFLCLFIFTAGIPGTLQKVSGQWSFTPNYYQYDASIIGTNTVYRLLEDPYGFIWLVSDKGILIFNGKSFETVKIPGNEQEIVNICRYKNKVFASTYSGKLFEIDMLTLEVKRISLPEPAASEATLFFFMNVIGDRLYLSKGHGTFLILDLKKNKTPILISHSNYLFRHLLYGDLSEVDFRFYPLSWMKLLDNKIFVENTIYELQNRNLKIFYTSGKDKIKLKQVSSYLKEDNDLYVGFLQSGGLVKYRNYNSGSDQNKPQSIIPDIEVGDILKDKKGNIWISTLHNGVFVFIKEEKQIQKFSTSHKLYHTDIWYVKHKKQALDIGYKQLVVDQFRNGLFYKRWIGDTTSNFNPVMLFHSYRDKAIILGSNSNFITGKSPGSIERKIAIKDCHVYKGEIYTTNPGVVMKFTPSLDLKVLLSDTSQINFYTMLPSDSVYIKGGANGLYIDNTPTKIKAKVSKVRKYNEDILACTDEGLYIKRGEKYFLIDEKKGLPDNQCIQIEYFGDQYYKLLTKTGLAYIDKAQCRVAGSFNAQLLGSDIIIHHFDVENGTIWLATNKGIFTLDERQILNNIRNNITAYLYPDKVTNRVIRYSQKELELQYNEEKMVQMIVEVLDFSPKAYYITYQIEKDNKIIAGPTPVADRSFYVNTTSPGNYKIKLSIGSDKNHVYQTLSYLLKITPLWYQTLWFKFTFGTVLAIVLWLIIRSIIRYIVRGKEKRIKEQYATLQLQSQAFFTQLNPHFIFNALTPLQSHILKNEKIESLEYLDRFSSLMRDILKNSDKTETSLRKELEFITKYIKIQQIRFTPSFVFKLHIDPDIDQDKTFIPAMLLQPIIENAIEHGIKNKGAEGIITVNIQTIINKGQECLQIEIGDNGVGIKHDFLKEGHALYILQKRIQTLQKQAGTIASLTHRRGKNDVGTIFTLLLSKTKNLWTP